MSVRTSASTSSFPDAQATLRALKRAAKAARKLSIETGTPFWVMKDGKIVDLNAGMKKTRRKKS